MLIIFAMLAAAEFFFRFRDIFDDYFLRLRCFAAR